VEEKMQANLAQFQQQEKLNASKHGLGGSKHGIGGSKHGLGGSLMSRLQVGLNKVEESSTPAKESNNTTADSFPGPDTPFHTPAKTRRMQPPHLLPPLQSTLKELLSNEAEKAERQMEELKSSAKAEQEEALKRAVEEETQ
jgi:hypothetical protein